MQKLFIPLITLLIISCGVPNKENIDKIEIKLVGDLLALDSVQQITRGLADSLNEYGFFIEKIPLNLFDSIGRLHYGNPEDWDEIITRFTDLHNFNIEKIFNRLGYYIQPLHKTNIPDSFFQFKSVRIRTFFTNSRKYHITFHGDSILDIKLVGYKIMPNITVELKDADSTFNIKPYNSEQTLKKDTAIYWEWDVNPSSPGKKELTTHIKIQQPYIIEFFRSEKIEKTEINIHKDVYVIAADWFTRIWTFVKTYWQWFTATIFIPLIIWLSRRKKKNNPSIKIEGFARNTKNY